MTQRAACCPRSSSAGPTRPEGAPTLARQQPPFGPPLPGSAASNAVQIQRDTSNARASVDGVESSALLSELNSERQYFGYQERGEGQTGPELLADLLGRRATDAIDNARPVRRSASLSAAQFANPSPTPRI
ncbi:hypothetical protein PaG_00823 [Moesziomyces aphidis]|uniref:Uncharacterized protein n=1 Tax=Moesziomyces aphidis TaxID=84754 RepID=W3VTH5_MOEAP|nr:hypothetical protein PaG_00823 [Moesziomyces aphidis]